MKKLMLLLSVCIIVMLSSCNSGNRLLTTEESMKEIINKLNISEDDTRVYYDTDDKTVSYMASKPLSKSARNLEIEKVKYEIIKMFPKCCFVECGSNSRNPHYKYYNIEGLSTTDGIEFHIAFTDFVFIRMKTLY